MAIQQSSERRKETQLAYCFHLQASHPRSIHIVDESDRSILDAIETVFLQRTEYAYMVWNWIHIPLTYKYTLSLLIPDALMMLDQLLQKPSGSLTIHWPAQEFSAKWQLEWESDELTIRSEWHSVIGATEGLLSERPLLEIDKAAFIAEWQELLGVVLAALVNAGYHDDQLIDLPKLREIHDRIQGSGILYKELAASTGTTTVE